jgi:hypothetical protein
MHAWLDVQTHLFAYGEERAVSGCLSTRNMRVINICISTGNDHRSRCICLTTESIRENTRHGPVRQGCPHEIVETKIDLDLLPLSANKRMFYFL